MGREMLPAMAQGPEARPTVSDFGEDNRWVSLAKNHWLKQGKVRKVQQDVIEREIWDPLEAESFALRSLLLLENLNILEKYVCFLQANTVYAN
jgi:intron-binding protein aquarius